MKNNITLNGKKILFLGQEFYDYHEKIIRQLKEFEAEVFFYENKIFNHDKAISTSLAAIFRRYTNPHTKEKYVEKILNETKDIKFDYLFCLGGFSVTEKLINEIRASNQKIKCILYLWDSFKVWNYTNLLPLFDTKFSFDAVDCAIHHDLQYLPLFYTDEYEEPTKIEQDIDLLYIGSVGAQTIDRCLILSQIQKNALQKKINIFFWVYYPHTKGLIKKLLNRLRRFISSPNHYLNIIENYIKHEDSFIKHNTLSRAEIVQLMKRSKCVVDIPVQNQAGLTIRTIETLATGKKIMTTNQYILQEKFFNKHMINVLDRNFNLDDNFINGQHEVLKLSHLWIGNWIKTIFDTN